MPDDLTRSEPVGDEQRRRADAVAARRRLLEAAPGSVRDLDAAARCECSCHPKPGNPEVHAGAVCSCQWTVQERSGHLANFRRVMEAGREQQEVEREADERELAAAAAALGIEVREESAAAPWVVVGTVDGHRFYLRERWDSYTIVLAPEGDPDLDPWAAPADAPTVLVRSGDASELYAAGRVDYARSLTLVAGEIRTYRRRVTCPHAHAPGDRYCPACGVPLKDRALPDD